ncbi:hypothetical protein OFO07_01030 [Campylobacter sp. JMF_06 NA1]|nr:hypothetical protein [Campylobacter sp. JMF_06 NA1]MDA3077506.1 hypothetical protein [Campylobacter sp. JMF_06 NA1]
MSLRASEMSVQSTSLKFKVSLFAKILKFMEFYKICEFIVR